MSDALPVTIRTADRGDAAGILAIHNEVVLRSTAIFDLVPRTLEDQHEWLAAHSGGHPAIVATVGDDVLGYGSLSPFRDRPGYATTVEDSVYVREDCQGRGIGHQLLDELVRLAVAHGFHCMIARIAGGNETSIGLHRACGFELVGVEREVGRKFGRWLDVVEMQRLL